MNLADRYRRWFDYERDMHAKVFASLRTIPEDQRADASYQKALDWLAHIAAARSLWLYRFGVAASGPDSDAELFPKNVPFEDVAAGVDSMHIAWSGFLQTLDDEALARVFEYRATEGDNYQNTIEDLLTQLFGHSSYHRGQIASVVRALGGDPAETDFVFWAREKLP